MSARKRRRHLTWKEVVDRKAWLESRRRKERHETDHKEQIERGHNFKEYCSQVENRSVNLRVKEKGRLLLNFLTILSSGKNHHWMKPRAKLQLILLNNDQEREKARERWTAQLEPHVKSPFWSLSVSIFFFLKKMHQPYKKFFYSFFLIKSLLIS